MKYLANVGSILLQYLYFYKTARKSICSKKLNQRKRGGGYWTINYTVTQSFINMHS